MSYWTKLLLRASKKDKNSVIVTGILDSFNLKKKSMSTYFSFLDINANCSNNWISCSFLIKAQWSLGSKCFPSYLKSDGSRSSTTRSLIQSRTSDVDGFFLRPGIVFFR